MMKTDSKSIKYEHTGQQKMRRNTKCDCSYTACWKRRKDDIMNERKNDDDEEMGISMFKSKITF